MTVTKLAKENFFRTVYGTNDFECKQIQIMANFSEGGYTTMMHNVNNYHFVTIYRKILSGIGSQEIKVLLRLSLTKKLFTDTRVESKVTSTYICYGQI